MGKGSRRCPVQTTECFMPFSSKENLLLAAADNRRGGGRLGLASSALHRPPVSSRAAPQGSHLLLYTYKPATQRQGYGGRCSGGAEFITNAKGWRQGGKRFAPAIFAIN